MMLVDLLIRRNGMRIRDSKLQSGAKIKMTRICNVENRRNVKIISKQSVQDLA